MSGHDRVKKAGGISLFRCQETALSSPLQTSRLRKDAGSSSTGTGEREAEGVTGPVRPMGLKDRKIGE